MNADKANYNTKKEGRQAPRSSIRFGLGLN